jgi:hypothetical protein
MLSRAAGPIAPMRFGLTTAMGRLRAPPIREHAMPAVGRGTALPRPGNRTRIPPEPAARLLPGLEVDLPASEAGKLSKVEVNGDARKPAGLVLPAIRRAGFRIAAEGLR